MTFITPQIYVAWLAAYNNGKLHRAWIDATNDLDDIQDQVNAMLVNSPEPDAEEYAIHDFDEFEGYSLSELTSLSKAHESACFIADNGALGAELLDYFDIDQAKNRSGRLLCW